MRARMVEYPGQYAWSSYRERVGEQGGSLLDELHADNSGYESYIDEPIPPGECEFIRESQRCNHVTGSGKFCEQIENAIGRRLQNRKPGRPRSRS